MFVVNEEDQGCIVRIPIFKRRAVGVISILFTICSFFHCLALWFTQTFVSTVHGNVID